MDYNKNRPHIELDGLAPAEFIRENLNTLNSGSELAT
jgi:transposase InsO family protein